MGVVIEFVDGRASVAFLELITGNRCGTRLPLHEGITFVGRQRQICEFRPRDALLGLVEAAQVLIRVDRGRAWVTDATSTDQTSLIREAIVSQFLAGLVVDEDVHQLPHEAFDTPFVHRRWMPLFAGDVLSHPYGCWRFSFSSTPERL